jgi:hypothetical protein
VDRDDDCCRARFLAISIASRAPFHPACLARGSACDAAWEHAPRRRGTGRASATATSVAVDVRAMPRIYPLRTTPCCSVRPAEIIERLSRSHAPSPADTRSVSSASRQCTAPHVRIAAIKEPHQRNRESDRVLDCSPGGYLARRADSLGTRGKQDARIRSGPIMGGSGSGSGSASAREGVPRLQAGQLEAGFSFTRVCSRIS